MSVRLGGLQILDDVSLEVPEGRIVGLIGPNGAGKTTVFNVICGFVPPSAGHVEWRGNALRSAPHELSALGIARTLQGVGLFDSLTVRDNILLGAHRPTRQDGQRCEELLGRLSIRDVADRLPTDLPYPTRKRVALARALMARPALLMLDEPAGGVAQEDIDALAVLLRELRSECSVLVVEHHMDFVMSTCDDIFVLDAGRLIAHGPPSEVQRDPAVRVAYLGEVDA